MAGSTSDATVRRNGGSRAIRPGSRWLVAGAALIVIVVAIAVVLLTTGGSQPKGAAALKYGTIPSWLPKPVPPKNQVVSATAAHPALAVIEGNTVHAYVAGGSAMVTAVGPAIPSWVSTDAQSGHWQAGETAPSTFTVTFAAAKGVVPLNPKAFSVMTAQGQVVFPAITVRGGGRLPAKVAPGKPLELTVRAGLPEGEGEIRWAPSGKVLVGWVYELELA